MTKASMSGKADSADRGSRMRRIALILPLAGLLALPAGAAQAKGGGLRPKANKDFRELVVRGERPEIAACMVAAIDYARHDAAFDAIRWDENASDRAVMNEKEVDGHFTRSVRLTTQMRTRDSTIFSETWQPVEISCDQPEDAPLKMHVTPVVG